ncbi:antibiotic acetyltransferase [Halomicroarcula sp. GCM10025817]|uniref:CatB-related O-acetyltransferase n=1 Tax=Haloarcula TaxID=2237 RepID=UPI0023E821E4|nr:antibiotic acetyltransferase [Halomicroarcula sp. SYNS111]
MPPTQRLKSAISRLLSKTGYPAIVRHALTASPASTWFEVSETATIARGARLEGDVEIGPGAQIERDAYARGRIEVADRARIGPESRLEGTVIVGAGTNLVRGVEAVGDVRFGKYNAIARRATLESRNHEMHRPSLQMRFYRDRLDDELPHVSDGPIRTGHDVWLGADVTVLSDVEVDTGAIVGARSVVTDDVPPYAIVAGVPAEHKGWRFDANTREQLLDIAWWDWSDDRIARNAEFFRTDLRNVDDLDALIV